jgi:hypothetical protein
MCGPARHSSQLTKRAEEIRIYAEKRDYSTRYCFLLDMHMPSGLKRFFVYDLNNNTVAFSGLVAHGSCDENFLKKPRFSNSGGSGCTSMGIYKICGAYYGQYGKSYRLYGLEKTNSNALSRSVVLHAFRCVPDEECYPKPICNSLGCPMVSSLFLKRLALIIDRSNKPVLLWVYDIPIPKKHFLFNRPRK